MQAQKRSVPGHCRFIRHGSQGRRALEIRQSKKEATDLGKLIKSNQDYCYFQCNVSKGVFLLWLKETNVSSALQKEHVFGVDDSLINVVSRLETIAKKNKGVKIVKMKSFQILFNKLLENNVQFIVLPESSALKVIEDNEGLEYRNMSTSTLCTKNCVIKPGIESIHATNTGANKAFEQFMRSVFLL